MDSLIVPRARAEARAPDVPPLPTIVPPRHANSDMLDAASEPVDQRVPPGDRLEVVRGVRKDFHSIRVNEQWRIVFRWTAVGPERVSLIDYN